MPETYISAPEKPKSSFNISDKTHIFSWKFSRS